MRRRKTKPIPLPPLNPRINAAAVEGLNLIAELAAMRDRICGLCDDDLKDDGGPEARAMEATGTAIDALADFVMSEIQDYVPEGAVRP